MPPRSARPHARKVAGAVGFVGCAADATAHFFGRDKGMGTMPHALIGYAGSTVRAAEMFHETFPDEPLTVLVDYFGRETSDAVAVVPALSRAGRIAGALAFRLDTPGGRYIEGLDLAALLRGARTPCAARRSAAIAPRRSCATWSAPGSRRRRCGICAWCSTRPGFPTAKIVASSGFGPEKCRMMAAANAPIDVIGTGSYLPELWSETYATADIIAYDGKPMVKAGREFLLRKHVDGQPGVDQPGASAAAGGFNPKQ